MEFFSIYRHLAVNFNFVKRHFSKYFPDFLSEVTVADDSLYFMKEYFNGHVPKLLFCPIFSHLHFTFCYLLEFLDDSIRFVAVCSKQLMGFFWTLVDRLERCIWHWKSLSSIKMCLHFCSNMAAFVLCYYAELWQTEEQKMSGQITIKASLKKSFPYVFPHVIQRKKSFFPRIRFFPVS